MSEALLKLIAKDVEDVQVISAVLQDAIAPVCDMAYQSADKNFIMVVHRFRRGDEGDQLSQPCHERTCCAINIRGVEAVQVQGLDLSDHNRMLDLLAILLEGGTLQLVFAGGARIRLQLGGWSMIIEDFGEAWPASCQPCHDEAG